MNTQMSAPLPLTDLGRLLRGPQADVHLTALTRALDDEVLRVRGRMAAGLAQAEFVQSSKRVAALHSAQMVLKSLQIYLAH